MVGRHNSSAEILEVNFVDGIAPIMPRNLWVR